MEEPGGEVGVPAAGEGSRLLREGQEGRLGDVLGQMRVADLPQRGGVDPVAVAVDELCEGALVVVGRENPSGSGVRITRVPVRAWIA